MSDKDDAFKQGYERIFGVKTPERGVWVYDHAQGGLIPKHEYAPQDPDGPAIMKPLDPFVSPVDGTYITDRAQLRKHNKAHGVTNINDYGENGGRAYFERKESDRQATLRSNSRQAKQERIDTIKHALDAATRR